MAAVKTQDTYNSRLEKFMAMTCAFAPVLIREISLIVCGSMRYLIIDQAVRSESGRLTRYDASYHNLLLTD